MKKDNISDILRKLLEMLHYIVKNESAYIDDDEISELLWDHFYRVSCRMKAMEIILTKVNTGISAEEMERIITTEIEAPH